MSGKAVLFTDNGAESKRARKFLKQAKIDFVEYDVKDQQELGCCGEGFTTEVPSIFAPEGIFRGMGEIRKYVKLMKDRKHLEARESAWW